MLRLFRAGTTAMRVFLAALVLAALAASQHFVSATLTLTLIDEAGSVSSVSALVGTVARLPCDLRPPAAGDAVTLVIWYKSGIASPIYSLDARDRPSRMQPTHWSDERTLGGRAFFRIGAFGQRNSEGSPDEAEGAHLAIENVREADAGAYRCRVDYHRSPTRNTLLNLSVIVPPHSLTLEDAAGALVAGAALGPYPEGAFVSITCIAHGGSPTPRVWWQKDGAPAADTAGEDGGGEALTEDSLEDAGGAPQGRGRRRAEATLRVGPLGRRDAGAELLCRAANSRLAPPLRRVVHIHMTLTPLAVRVLDGDRSLRAGRTHETTCEAVGGRPPPTLVWRLDGRPLLQARQETSADGNVTRSVLVFTPTPDDLGKELECVAVTAATAAAEDASEGGGDRDTSAALRDSWTLDITFPPELQVSLGANLNASAIREGEDVYLECLVRAHPRVSRVEWRHSGRPLSSNASGGILLSNQTLVLQTVRNASAGPYACAASNPQGHATSRPFVLDVKYAPVCRPHQQRVYGGARLETLQVSCEVDANPPAALFRWSFNSSAVAAREVTSVASVAGGGRSLAAYTPRAERDFGTLLCWGRNVLGAQNEPCVFHVVPAGRPEAPRACAVANRTWSALQVRCSRGFDGGLPQQFTLEVFKTERASSRRIVANVTARSAPEFTVNGLEPSVTYELSLYATNGKGRSEDSVSLRATTLRAGAHEPRRTVTAGNTAAGASTGVGVSGGGLGGGGGLAAVGPGSWPPEALWALAGAGAALAAAGATAAAMAALRARGVPPPVCCPSSDEDERSSGGVPSPAPVPSKGLRGSGGGTRSAPDGGTLLPTAGLEDNPDVVPHSGESDLESHVYKSFLQDSEKHSFGYSTRAHSMDSAFQTPLYVSLHSYSRVPTTETLLSSETGCGRWTAWPSLRDVATQAQPPPQASTTQSQPSPFAAPHGAAASNARQHAETQTPPPLPIPPLLVPARHKESAV